MHVDFNHSFTITDSFLVLQLDHDINIMLHCNREEQTDGRPISNLSIRVLNHDGYTFFFNLLKTSGV